MSVRPCRIEYCAGRRRLKTPGAVHINASYIPALSTKHGKFPEHTSIRSGFDPNASVGSIQTMKAKKILYAK